MLKLQSIIKSLFLISLFFSLHLHAGEITKKSILGTWYEKDNLGSEVTTFLSDGTWTAKITYLDLLTNMKKTASVNGTWKLVDKTLVKTITWAKDTKLKGRTISYKILSATEKTIKFREGNKKGVMKRVKKRP